MKSNTTLCIFLLFSFGTLFGCAKDHDRPHGFTIKLEPKKEERVSATSKNKFSKNTLLATPASLGDLNCIGINVVGGAVGGAPSCNALINVGMAAGSIGSRPATFDLSVPTTSVATIEAYGFQASVCPPMDSVFSQGILSDPSYNGKIYRIGQVTTPLTEETVTVTVPIGFDPNISFNCNPTPNLAPHVSAGTSFSCAHNKLGNVFCWGAAGSGQLGNNSSSQSSTPVQVSSVGGGAALKDMKFLSSGNSHSCAVGIFGGVLCWGTNANGELGNNSTTSSATPVQVSSISGAVQASAMGGGSCAVNSASNVLCWGANSNGQLGNNSTSSSLIPVQVSGVGGAGSLTNILSVTGGTNFACARSNSGAAFCWGAGSAGQLGNNGSTQSSTPVQVVGVGGTGLLSGISAIAASANSTHVCAVSNTGDVYCWGNGSNGQLGYGGTTQSNYPTHVVGVGGTGFLSNIANISVGTSSSCAVSNSGEVFCWGAGGSGQLGNNASTQSNTPVQVVGVSGTGFITGITQVAVGNSQTCGVSSGAAFCWGSNSNGELGNNSTSQSNIPVQVFGVGGGGYLQLN